MDKENIVYRTELCVHSGYSKLSPDSISNIIEMAKLLNINAIALCDDNSTYGFLEFYGRCKAKDIKAIYGITITINNARVAILAKHKEGIRVLNSLCSAGGDGFYEPLLQDEHENIISILLFDENNSDTDLDKYDYIGVSTTAAFEALLDKKVDLKKVVVLSDSYYLNVEDSVLHETLLGHESLTNKKIKSNDEIMNKFPRYAAFTTPEYISSLIDDDCYNPDNNESYEYNNLLLNRINKLQDSEYFKNHKEGLNYLSKEIKNYINFSFIYDSIYKISEELHSKNITYFLRQSGGASIISYLLGISDVDPLKYGICPYTLVGIDGDKLPDFDFATSHLNYDDKKQIFKNTFDDNFIEEGSLIPYGYRDIPFVVGNYLHQREHVYDVDKDLKIFKLNNAVKEVNHTGKSFFIKPSSIGSFYSYGYTKDIEQDIKAFFPIGGEINYPLYKVDVFYNFDVDFLNILESDINKDIKDEELFDSFMKALNSGKTPFFDRSDFANNFVLNLIKEIKPTNINELISIMGFSYGTNCWSNNASLLVKDDISALEFPSTRDDVFNMLHFKYGIDELTSYKVMESVRKGKGITKEDLKRLLTANVPDYLISYLNKVKYLTTKSYCVSKTLIALKLVYYRCNYKNEYIGAFINVLRPLDICDIDKIVSLSKEELKSLLNTDIPTEEKHLVTLLIEK